MIITKTNKKRPSLCLLQRRQKCAVFIAQKHMDGSCTECLYLLPKDHMAERWTGKRLTPDEAETLSGIADIRELDRFSEDFAANAAHVVYLDLHKQVPEDIDRPAHVFAKTLAEIYPDRECKDMNPYVRKLRTIKQACENGTLNTLDIRFKNENACCVVMASEGYPVKYDKGFEITADELPETAELYIAGAKLDGEKLLTNGGRVLGVVETAASLQEAIEKAYEAVKHVHFGNAFYRKDIGARALLAYKENN